MDIKQLYNIFIKNQKIATDTRKDNTEAIFICLKGENFNGNKFAKKAVENGAKHVIIDDPDYYFPPECILVHDSLDTLQKLAEYHRNKLNLPIIGITGSNGKTTTKELISSVLSKKYSCLSTSGNLNNHIGVPLTILSIKPRHHDIAVIEMGANHIGEISKLCSIAKPGFGLITNIGKAHLEGFGGYKGVIKAKSELYDHIKKNNGTLFVNQDNQLLTGLSENSKVISYGIKKKYNCTGSIKESSPLLKINWLHSDHTRVIQTKLFGSYNFENLMAAICIGKYFDVNEKDIVQAIESYIPKNQRSQVIWGKNNYIIQDSYNANPSSMLAGIKEFVKIKKENKILILGDMLELGKESLTEHTAIIEFIKKQRFEKVILVGEHFSEAARKTGFLSFTDVYEVINWLKTKKPRDKTFFVKGSRGIKLEYIIEYIQ